MRVKFGAAALIAMLAISGSALSFGDLRPYRSIELPGLVYGVAVGDINGDGRGDIASGSGEIANDSAHLMLSRNRGFKAPMLLHEGGDPEGTVIGRINRGNRLDIAVANYEDHTINFHFQKKDGSFRSPPALPVGEGNWQLKLADFDGDGDMDIVTANYDNGTGGSEALTHLVNVGGGIFAPPVDYPGAKQSMAVEVGRIDRGRRPDAAVIGVGGTLNIFRGTRSGTLKNIKTIETGATVGIDGLALSDFTGDGKLDAAVGDWDGDQVLIFRGNGRGNFRPLGTVPVGDDPQAIDAANFDADRRRRPDLAVTRGGAAEDVLILRGRGDGSFKPLDTLDLPSAPRSLSVGRIDRRGGPDLVVGTDASVEVFRNFP